MILALKIIVILIVVMVFFLTLYKTTRGVSAGKGLLYFMMEVLVFAAIGYGAQWAVTQSFIKVELRKFRNTPLPTSEKLAVKGCVKNVGSYKAKSVTLHVKVINNAAAGMSKGKDDSRENTLELNTVVARNLAKGTTKCFNKRFPYPPYFRLAHIKAHISAN
jgi:hypothetical protein